MRCGVSTRGLESFFRCSGTTMPKLKDLSKSQVGDSKILFREDFQTFLVSFFFLRFYMLSWTGSSVGVHIAWSYIHMSVPFFPQVERWFYPRGSPNPGGSHRKILGRTTCPKWTVKSFAPVAWQRTGCAWLLGWIANMGGIRHDTTIKTGWFKVQTIRMGI